MTTTHAHLTERQQQIFEAVRPLIAEGIKAVKDEEDIAPSDTLIEKLGADSLELVELIMTTEEWFGKHGVDHSISDEDAENLVTVMDVVDYVDKHLPADVEIQQ